METSCENIVKFLEALDNVTCTNGTGITACFLFVAKDGIIRFVDTDLNISNDFRLVAMNEWNKFQQNPDDWTGDSLSKILYPI